MIYKNRRSKISETKFRQIVRHFSLDLTATAVRCIDWYFTAFYQHHLSAYAVRMAQWCAARSPLGDALESDELYFGARTNAGQAW